MQNTIHASDPENWIAPIASGVYLIKNELSGLCYVGSTKNLKTRLRGHRTSLRGGYHPTPHLQRAFNHYGEAAFTTKVLELCEEGKNIEREAYWILRHDSVNTGYNTRPAAASNSGWKWPKELRDRVFTKELMEKRKPANRKNWETGLAIWIKDNPGPWTGKKMSEESCERRRQSMSGQKRSDSTPWIKTAGKKIQRPISLVSPDGDTWLVNKISAFCEKFQINRVSVYDLMKGKNESHFGWRVLKFT